MSDLAIKLPAYKNQTEINLRRWEEICADPFYSSLGHRIETDRHGHIIMTPPAGRPHGTKQFLIAQRIGELLAKGEVVTECPISTSDGVRSADVSWLSENLSSSTAGENLLRVAPEICVEVISPLNTPSEMADKKALYFDAGASEVWFCREDGTMEFYLSPSTEPAAQSAICPNFPKTIER